MKNLYRILSSLVLCSALAGCGLLEENPTTILAENSTFKSEESLESSLRGVLNAFHGNSMYTHDMQEFMQTASCLAYFPQGSVVGGQNGNERYYTSYHYAQSSTTKLNNEIYLNHYVGISRCNKLIDGLKNSPVADAYKTEIEAEARFYRAVLYFSLVRFYGDVPLMLSSTQTDSPRESYDKVYKQILDDLTFAENNMRNADRVIQLTPTESRPNKWAATAFKASVYVQIGSYLSAPGDHAFGTLKTGPLKPDFAICGIESAQEAWSMALETAENVIDNGPYELAGKYTDLFKWTNPEDYMLKERIFVLTTTQAFGSGQLARRSLPEYPDGTMNTTTRNSNYGRFRPTRFVFQKWASTYGGEKGVDSENSNIYVSCPDPRFDATFIHTKFRSLNNGQEYDIYPANASIQKNSRKNYLPYFRKYLDPLYNANCGNADFYFMRYAEVYLMAAEAAASLCTSPSDTYGQKAYAYIEVLHSRARKTTTTEASQPKWEAGCFASKEELITAIMWERVFEMYGEGHEWFDTHRRGTTWFLKNIIKPMNVSLRQPEQEKAKAWYGDGFSWSEDPTEIRKGLFNAFPNDELMYNRVLTSQDQNVYSLN